MPDLVAADDLRSEPANNSTTSTAETSIKPGLRDYLDAKEASMEFCRPHFEKGVRMYRLFAGHPPPEVAGTFSQIMLWFPWSIIEEEIPIQTQGMMQSSDWLTLSAQDFMLEPSRRAAEKWLRSEMENVQEYSRTVIPSFQSTSIFGNGYRFYGHRYENNPERKKVPNVIEMGMVDPGQPFRFEEQSNMHSIITGEYVNYFNVLPSPNGGLVNPNGRTAESGLDYLIVNLYPNEDFLKTEVANGTFDKDEAAKMFRAKSTGDPEADASFEFKDQVVNTEGQWNSFQAPEWVEKMKAKNNRLQKRYRVSWLFQRKRWIVVAEDKYVLYDGEPMFSFWPLANFISSFNLDNFMGTSLLETVEDLLISMIQNFNMRQDYLVGQFHPPTYLPQKLVNDCGGDKANFDWTPYKLETYSHKAFPNGIGQYIHHDVPPDLTQQAFLEQGQLQEYLENIIGQHGSEAVQSNTATGATNLMSKDVARKMMRAINVDQTGTRESAQISLKLGAMFRNKDEMVNTGAQGLEWERIDHEAIQDGYSVFVNGARHMLQAENLFKKQLSVAPALMNDPQIRGAIEMKRQLMEGAGFENVPLIINGEPEKNPARLNEQLQEAPMPGGIPSSQNETRSVAGATSGQPSLAGAGAV